MDVLLVCLSTQGASGDSVLDALHVLSTACRTHGLDLLPMFQPHDVTKNGRVEKHQFERLVLGLQMGVSEAHVVSLTRHYSVKVGKLMYLSIWLSILVILIIEKTLAPELCDTGRKLFFF